MLQLFYWSNRI